MEKSSSITEIFKALALFHIKVGKIKKDAKNPFFKSSYSSLENILDEIRDPLTESELEFVQFPTGDYGLTTLLVHIPSGEFLQDCYNMQPAKSDPQGAGSVISYQRRYALLSILALNQEDDDANRGTHGAKMQEAPKKNNYNHSTLGTQAMPLISNLQFKQLIERVEKKGDTAAYKKALEMFTFEATQRRVLEEVFAALIDKEPVTLSAEKI